MSFNPFVHRFAQAGIITPLDTSRLTNWPDVFPGLRSAPFLNVDGKPYGRRSRGEMGHTSTTPRGQARGAAQVVPRLLDPQWKKRITMGNDAAAPITTIGLAMGFANFANLTQGSTRPGRRKRPRSW